MSITDKTDSPAEYFSAGKLFGLTQLSVPTIERVLLERGIGPNFHIDNVAYYDGAALSELRSHLRGQTK